MSLSPVHHSPALLDSSPINSESNESIDPRAAEIAEHAKKIAGRFLDGFTPSDILAVTIQAIEIAETLTEVKGVDKKEFAIDIIKAVKIELNTEIEVYLETTEATIDAIVLASKGIMKVNNLSSIFKNLKIKDVR